MVMTDPFPADTLYGPPVNTMTKSEVMVELQIYKPRTLKEVHTDEPWMERRRRLWHRSDWFNRLRSGS